MNRKEKELYIEDLEKEIQNLREKSMDHEDMARSYAIKANNLEEERRELLENE